ncbi:hypothetical protein [Paremcibacter congregatus]|nr:hypothetical protein [Paremcibacter congregatus]QDE28058.1 hypothetical protein FIV45_12670 [Paremcibacter congregatus]
MIIEKHLLKTEYQKWLCGFSFSHCVVVQPTPKQWFDENEITQRLRTVVFRINKKFLKPSFPKWEHNDKCWMVGFKEGNRIERNIHYHFMFHSPKISYKNKADFTSDAIKNMINDEWLKIPSINHYNYDERDDLNEILHLSEVSNNFSAINYASKKYDPKNDYDQPIYIGLKD